MYSYVTPEERVPDDHPLRKIRPLVDPVLKEMSPQCGKLYSEQGRHTPSCTDGSYKAASG
jgi:hypothetical protein